MSFFKGLALLMQDRQDFRLQALKVKEDLVLTITPDFKGKGKITHITVPAEDLQDPDIDSKIFGALNGTPTSEKATYQEAQTDAPERDDDDDDDSSSKKPATSKSKPAAKKSAPSKKAAPAKKAAAKKPAAGGTKKASNVTEPAKSVTKVTENVQIEHENVPAAAVVQTCRKCGCTQNDCRQCIEKTGQPCHWVEDDLCSACDTESIQEEKEVLKDVMDNNGMNNPEPEPAPAAATSEPDNKKLFDEFMKKGAELFADTARGVGRYKEAQDAYTSAVELFPDNAKAQAELKKATQWVKATAGLPSNK